MSITNMSEENVHDKCVLNYYNCLYHITSKIVTKKPDIFVNDNS